MSKILLAKMIPFIRKRDKGKGKILHPIKEMRNCVNLHSLNENSNEEIHALIISSISPSRRKGGKKAMEHTRRWIKL
jgi:hypothetical protein